MAPGPNPSIGVDAYYLHVSPQLLARVRQMWSARGFDLDELWRMTIRDLPGFRPLEPGSPPFDSRPVDLLLLFDQGASWVQCLRAAIWYGLGQAGADPPAALSIEQLRSLLAILSRLRDELAGVRALALAGLATPAMQITRSISEDVDTALVMLLRKKIARRFAECRSPQEAGDFWRRHIAGGRAFRTVTEELYRVGLDYAEGSAYAQWRKEVLLLLGSAVHTSYPSGAGGRPAGQGTGLDPATQECLYLATLRVQEMCVYSLVLGKALQQQLAACLAHAETAGRGDGADSILPLLRAAARGGEIIVEQMRWLTSVDGAGEPAP